MADAQSSIRWRRRSKREITARVGCLGGVLSRMGERGFDYLTRRIRVLRRPVQEARPEPMRHGGDAEFLGQSR